MIGGIKMIKSIQYGKIALGNQNNNHNYYKFGLDRDFI